MTDEQHQEECAASMAVAVEAVEEADMPLRVVRLVKTAGHNVALKCPRRALVFVEEVLAFSSTVAYTPMAKKVRKRTQAKILVATMDIQAWVDAKNRAMRLG